MHGKKDFFSGIVIKLAVSMGGAILLMGIPARATPAPVVSPASNAMNSETHSPLPADLILLRRVSGSRVIAAQVVHFSQQPSFTPIPAKQAIDVLNSPEIKDLTHLKWEIDKGSRQVFARMDKVQQRNAGNPAGPQIENLIPGAKIDNVEKGGAIGYLKGAMGTMAGLAGTHIPEVSRRIPNSADSASNKYLFSDPAIFLGDGPNDLRGPSREQVAAIKKYADAIGHQLGGFPADAQRMYENVNSGPTNAKQADVNKADDITHRLNIDSIIFKASPDGVGLITARLTEKQAKYFTQYLDEAFNGGKGMTEEQFFGSKKFTYTPEATAPALGAITGGKISVDSSVTQTDIDALVQNRVYIKALSDSGPEIVNLLRSLKQSGPKAQNNAPEPVNRRGLGRGFDGVIAAVH